MKALTFLICTRNGSSVLAECIDSIGRQKGISFDAIEVVLVDNGSTDETARIGQSALARLKCATKFAVEMKEGKVNAFLRGVLLSEAQHVAVIDDDNLIEEEFALRTLQLFSHFDQLGMVGSANEIDAQDIPTWFSLARGTFACAMPHLHGEVRTIDENRAIASQGAIAGAGSTFRRDPLVRALELGFRFSNDALRRGRLASGEDIELCCLFQHCGYWFGFDKRIRLRHRINPARLTWSYALRMARGHGWGGPLIDGYIWMQGENPIAHKGTWWWIAARRLRRLATLLPGVLSHFRKPAKVMLLWEAELGGLIRMCRERGAFSRKVEEMKLSRWATQLHNYRTQQRDASAPEPYALECQLKCDINVARTAYQTQFRGGSA